MQKTNHDVSLEYLYLFNFVSNNKVDALAPLKPNSKKIYKENADTLWNWFVIKILKYHPYSTIENLLKLNYNWSSMLGVKLP